MKPLKLQGILNTNKTESRLSGTNYTNGICLLEFYYIRGIRPIRVIRVYPFLYRKIRKCLA